jgi:hypothetical protein
MAGSTLPHPRPTGSSSGWRPSITARYFSSCPSDSTSRRTPCPLGLAERWLQVRLGCIPLSLLCPFRLLHTCLPSQPARRYPRLWIQCSSFEHRRDFNPPESCAAQRTIGLIRSPRTVGGLQLSANSLIQFRSVTLHPSPDRRWINREVPLAHYLRQIAIAERVAQVPANTEHDNLIRKMPSSEQCCALANHRASR